MVALIHFYVTVLSLVCQFVYMFLPVSVKDELSLREKNFMFQFIKFSRFAAS